MLPLFSNANDLIKKRDSGESLSDKELSYIDKYEKKQEQNQKKIDAIVERYSNLVSRDEIRVSKLGRLSTITSNIGTLSTNMIDTFKKGLSDSIFGQTEEVKNGLKEGNLRKTTALEKIFTGKNYTDNILEEKKQKKRESPELEEVSESSRSNTREFDEVTIKANIVKFLGENPETNTRTVDTEEAIFIKTLEDVVASTIDEMLTSLPEELKETVEVILKRIDIGEAARLLSPSDLSKDSEGNLIVNTSALEAAISKMTEAVLKSDEEKQAREEADKRDKKRAKPKLTVPQSKQKESTDSSGLGIVPTVSLSALLPSAATAAAMTRVAGSIFMAAVDGIIGYFKADDWGTSKSSAVIGSIVSSSSSGIIGAIGGGAKYAMLGATIGSVVPGIGTLAGAIVGAAFGGIVGYIGGETFAKWIDNISGAVSDTASKIWDSAKQTYNDSIVSILSYMQRISDYASETKDMLANKVSEYINDFKKLFSDFSSMFSSDFIAEKINDLRSFVSDKIIEFMQSIKDFASRIFTKDFWFGSDGQGPADAIGRRSKSVTKEFMENPARLMQSSEDLGTTINTRPKEERENYYKLRRGEITQEQFADSVKGVVQTDNQARNVYKKFLEDINTRQIMQSDQESIRGRAISERDSMSLQRAERIDSIDGKRLEIEKREQTKASDVKMNSSQMINSGNRTTNAIGVVSTPYNNDPTILFRSLDHALGMR